MSVVPAMANAVSRRTTLKWLSLVATAIGLSPGFGSSSAVHARAATEGYGRDPNLLSPLKDPWPLVLTARQRATAGALLDVILPGEGASPRASEVGLVDFLDEWVSAPYPEQQADAARLIPMLEDLGRDDQPLVTPLVPDAVHREAFGRLCVLAAAAYYTAPAGLAAIGFVGNTPRASFEGPPEKVLKHFESAFGLLRR